ncbi:Hpt domain-containing protein [Longivirga aurantiaca]|uniref:Hpt domain-containing protein n=1 Tax=Longivirga aurantiaca TaxID=1837743 RepID=A0ABW1SVJ8_9ACTN
MSDITAETVNRARLDSLVDEIGDQDIVRQAVQSFLDELVERLQAIRTTISGGDAAEIKKAAHALGSPAAMLGAIEVNRICRAMQDQCDAGGDVLAPVMADLDASSARTVSGLRAYLAESAATA